MIKTDYSKVSDLFLAYPFGFNKEYHSLLPFFDTLISLVPDDIRLFLIVNSKKAAERLEQLFPNKQMKIVLIKGFYEPWLRDIMGFNGGDYIIKPQFKPDYYKDVYTPNYLAKIDSQVREIIGKTINKEIIDLPLIMDGGNLITNGEVGFITEKLVRDNNHIPDTEVLDLIEEYLKIKPVIIPTSKFDYLGHADGFVSFLNDTAVGIAYNPNEAEKEDSYYQQLERIVQANDLNVIKLLDNPSTDKSRKGKDFIYSASGCYVNYLRLNETFIFPQYSQSPEPDSLDYNAVNNNTLSSFASNLKPINCDALAKQGGVLRCLSFVN